MDGIGSIIKSIFDNRDYLDAAKYDDDLKALHNNQFRIEVKFNNHHQGVDGTPH